MFIKFITKVYKRKQMQIEKHLFRISQRTLKSSNAPIYWKSIYAFFLTVAIYKGVVLGAGHLFTLPSNESLSECFQKSIQTSQSKFKLQTDSIYIMHQKPISSIKLFNARQQKLVAAENEYCAIIKGMNSTNIMGQTLQFTWTPNILFLDSKDRYDYNFTNYTIVLKNFPSTSYFFYGMDIMVANQLVSNPQGLFPNNPYIRTNYYTVSISSPIPSELTILGKIMQIFKVLAYYFIVSIVTSLYIYGTIIAAPAVIIIFLRCSNFARQGGNMTDVYKVFPWIGMHSLIRETSQNPKIKQTSKQICSSIIIYFFLLYFIYYGIIVHLSKDIFYQKAQQDLEQILFGYIALIEFCAIVFMRTRPFIKYFPPIHTMLVVLFLIYAQVTPYGLKKDVLIITCSLSAMVFSYMVINAQIPAQTTWDRNKKYTPTVDRPRIGFLPLFNMSWINNLPQEWTLLFPLFGRQHFTQSQLSFVDRNFQQLDRVLNTQNVRGGLQNNQGNLVQN